MRLTLTLSRKENETMNECKMNDVLRKEKDYLYFIDKLKKHEESFRKWQEKFPKE
jgi:hypothetical protein